MQRLIDFLSANPWMNLLFLILAVGGIIVSLILYFWSRKEKILVYSIKSFNLIHNSVVKIPGLSIKYENANIGTLTLSKIAFWNKGHGTINKTDIAQTDKIRIIPCEEATILTATITYKSRDANNFKLDRIGDSIVINFDYIDFHQGVILDVYHTGENNKCLNIIGTIKGGRDLTLENTSENYLADKIVLWVFKKFPGPQNLIFNFFYRIILLLIFFIPMIVIFPIDKSHKLINRLPQEFDLSV